MPEDKSMVATFGRFLSRALVLIVLLLIALTMLIVSSITGATVENVSEDKIRAQFPEWSKSQPWFPVVIGFLFVILPGVLPVMLREHALKQIKSSSSEAARRSWDFLRGRNEQRAGATLWALLQVDLLLLFPLTPVGAALDKSGLIDLNVEQIIQPEVEVQYLIQPMIERIRFDKAMLAPGGEFILEGGRLAAADKAALRTTVEQFNPGEGCSVTVTVEGFASDEEFGGLCEEKSDTSKKCEQGEHKGSCPESDQKNLEVADYRAASVYEALRELGKDGNEWLKVVEPMRWMPATNTCDAVTKRWSEMSLRRNELVFQPSDDRDPGHDRIVVLDWHADGPCEVPASTENTEPMNEE